MAIGVAVLLRDVEDHGMAGSHVNKRNKSHHYYVQFINSKVKQAVKSYCAEVVLEK